MWSCIAFLHQHWLCYSFDVVRPVVLGVCFTYFAKRWPSCRPFLINVNRPASNAVPSTDIGNRLLSNGVLRLPVALVLQRCPFGFRWYLSSNGVPSTSGGACSRPSTVSLRLPVVIVLHPKVSLRLPMVIALHPKVSLRLPMVIASSIQRCPVDSLWRMLFPSNGDVPYIRHPLICAPV